MEGVWILGEFARGLVRKWTQASVAAPEVEEFGQVAAEAGDVRERMDFAERLTTVHRESERLGDLMIGLEEVRYRLSEV